MPRRRLEAFNADDNLTTLAYVPGGYGLANALRHAMCNMADRRERGIIAAEMIIELLRPDNEPNYEGHNRRGDLGADGVYIADDEQQVLLFQSKSSSALSDSQLSDYIAAFIHVPGKLLRDEWKAKAHPDRWASMVLEVTLDALVDAFGDAQGRDPTTGLREFFREKKHQSLIEERFGKALLQTARHAERAGIPLEEYLRVETPTT